MDRKILLAIIRHARKSGWDGTSVSDFKSWCADQLVDEFDDGNGNTFTLKDVEDAWRHKTVTITADAGEEVVVEESPEDAETEAMDDDEDAKAGDDDEDGPIPAKSASRNKSADSRAKFTAVKRADTAGGPAVHTGKNVRLKRMYNAAAQNGGLYRGKRPAFGDAETLERFNAGVRIVATRGGVFGYKQFPNDMAIWGKTAGSIGTSAWAGTLLVEDVAPELIDLLDTFGAARQLAGVTDMTRDIFQIKRKTGDMTFAYVNENTAIGETNPSFDEVTLTAKKVAGIARLSNELLNDSAFDLGDEIAQSTQSGANKFEDEDYFNGTFTTGEGLLGNVDADSTFDAALSTGWEDYTINKIQQWLAKIPNEARKSGTVQIACSQAFFQSVLNRFALSAGGTAGRDVLQGAGGGAVSFDGIPVVITEVLPSSYNADQISAYAGSFKRGTKLGIVRGSGEISASSDRYWDQDQFAWRYTERLALKYHDVGGADSEVVALQD